MKEYIIPRHIVELSSEYYRRTSSLDNLKVCPYCNQPIKKRTKKRKFKNK